MVHKILSAAGFVKNETYRETRFIKAPKTTYCVYMDGFTRRGADNKNLITDHAYTIELYCYAPDPDAEKRIETALDDAGIEFDKQDRYWIDEEQLYQVIYAFEYHEK